MRTNYPTFEQIEALHRKYAPSEQVFALVWQHSQIVAEIAQELIEKNKLDVDQEFVRTGSLLHDIGAYLFISPEGVFDKQHYIEHAHAGFNILKKEGFQTAICDLVESHAGVGISKKDVQSRQLNIPAKDYFPQTIEAKLVLYADKFHTKSPAFYSVEGYKKYVAQWGEDKAASFEKLVQEFGSPDLSALSEKHHQPIR